MNDKFSALLLAGLGSSPVFAGDAGTSDAGLHYAQASYEETAYGYDIEGDPSLLVGRFGHYLTDYFSLEGRVGLGLSDDDVSVNGYDTDITVEIDHLFGAYAVGHLPITHAASIYALAGFTKGEATAKYGDLSTSGDDSGFSYGVGGEVNFFSRQFSGTLEYMSYLDKSDYEVSAISAGVNYRF